MSNSFEDYIKSHVTMYMDSEEGQKSMLLSMFEIFIDKNIDKADLLLKSIPFFDESLKDITHILNGIKHFINANKSTLSSTQCHKIQDVIFDIFNILESIDSSDTDVATVVTEIDRIYKKISIFNISKRIVTLEELLSLDLFENEKDEPYHTEYTPPERAQESKLKKYGYSVAWDNPLSNRERQELLKDLINTGKVSKGYVISYLKHNIQINGKKSTNEIAVSKWKDDLDFVYNL